MSDAPDERPKRKFNHLKLTELLEQYPNPPDSYSMDFMIDHSWIQVIPKGSPYSKFNFSSKNQLVLEKEDGEENGSWHLHRSEKKIVLELPEFDNDYEISYEHYHVEYISTNWMVWKCEDIIEKTEYRIFASVHLQPQKIKISHLKEELMQHAKTEKPNSYLLILAAVLFIILIILMMSF
jgi:hypothetical protein